MENLETSVTISPQKQQSNQEIINQAEEARTIPRPHNLEDLVQKEELSGDIDAKTTFYLEDLNDDEEIWLMEIPKRVPPEQLIGKSLQLGDKSTLKIEDEKYHTVNHESFSSITCVLNTDKETNSYSAINIKPRGVINIRKKLSGVRMKIPHTEENKEVPFPKNLKMRDPFIHFNNCKIKKESHSKRKRKSNS